MDEQMIIDAEIPAPEPEGVEVDDYTRAVAERLCNEHFSTKSGRVLISQYVRKKPRLVSIKVDLQKPGEIIRNFEKGDMVGALVAFKSATGVRIGWSSYNNKKETFPFTRKDAIRIAIIRSLVDGIDNEYTTSGTQIPKFIMDALPNFVRRAAKYYYAMPVNVR